MMTQICTLKQGYQEISYSPRSHSILVRIHNILTSYVGGDVLLGSEIISDLLAKLFWPVFCLLGDLLAGDALKICWVICWAIFVGSAGKYMWQLAKKGSVTLLQLEKLWPDGRPTRTQRKCSENKMK